MNGYLKNKTSNVNTNTGSAILGVNGSESNVTSTKILQSFEGSLQNMSPTRVCTEDKMNVLRSSSSSVLSN